MTARRFPPPWTVEDIGAAFVVKDGTGQKLAYVYYEDEPGRRSAAKLLTRDEAHRLAVDIAKLPGTFAQIKNAPPQARAGAEQSQDEEEDIEFIALITSASMPVF